MASNWYYEENGDRKGPVDSKTLRQLADNGTIKSTTSVWREGMKDWVKAGSVKGLLPAPHKPQSRPVKPKIATTQSPIAGDEKGLANDIEHETPIKPWHKWPIVALLVTCCFPVGLVLVWKHPRWTTITKSLWTGGFLVIVITGQIVSHFEKAAVAEKLTQAEELWEADRKPEAINIYRRLIDRDILHVDTEDRPLLFERTVTFDAENGNTEAAMKVLDNAEMFGVTLTFQSEAAREVVAIREQQKEQERRKREEEERLAELTRQAEKRDRDTQRSTRNVVRLSQRELLHFIDHTSEYAGKTVSVPLEYGASTGLRTGPDNVLIPFRGMALTTGGSYSHFDIKIRFSSADPVAKFDSLNDLPNVVGSDDVTVTFYCENGSLTSGNRAVTIDRR